MSFTGGADKSLARPGRKKLQRPNSNFCKPLKKKSEGCPSNQVFSAAMTSTSDEKWRTLNCFFSKVGLRTYQHPSKNTAIYPRRVVTCFVSHNNYQLTLQRRNIICLIQGLSPYRAVNTFHLGYKNQSVYAVSGTSRCLFSDKYKTHKY